jgi:polyhydroxybutyrate depolymerase
MDLNNIKHITMRVFLTSILFIAIHSLLLAQTTVNDTLQHDGLIRKYTLRLPAGVSANDPRPLVFNFHGYGSNAVQQQLYSAMNIIADAERFVVCYPDGIANAWNVGWSFGSTADDIGFVRKMIDKLVSKYGLDPERVYSCGMSNGGFFSYRLACEMPDKIAAIASVTGSIVPEYKNQCNPDRPTPILEIHGTEDRTVEYNGSQLAMSIPDVLNLWKEKNGCITNPIRSDQPNTANDGMNTEIYTYKPCNGGTEILHYKVIGGGHTWPGAPFNIGPTTTDFSASKVIWDFFKRFTLSRTSGIDESNIPEKVVANSIVVDQLLIQLPQTSQIQIIDLSGHVCLSQSYRAGTLAIDMSSFTSGIYVVKSVSNGKQSVEKIIKIN